MASVKLEGGIEDISPKQLDFIKSVLEKRGFENTTGVISTVGDGGHGFMASVKRVTVEKDGQKFTAILKIASTIEKIRQMMNTRVVFNNEHVMYTEVFPKLADLEKEANIPKSSRIKVAECYGSSDEDGHEVLIIEDLSDFVMLDKYKPMSNENIKKFLKELVKLHTFSYVLKNKSPEEFRKLKEKLINIYESPTYGQVMAMATGLLEQDILGVFGDERHKKALAGTVSQMTNLIKNVVTAEDEKYFVFTHGDAWTNNVMFRLENGETGECCMIDFQAPTLRSPISDVYFVLLHCTDYKNRQKYFREWIDFYHTELAKLIFKYGLNINDVCPTAKFDADLKKYAKSSLALSAVMFFFFVKESSEAAEIKKNLKEDTKDQDKFLTDSFKLTTQDEVTINKYRTKLEGIIDTLIDLRLLSI